MKTLEGLIEEMQDNEELKNAFAQAIGSDLLEAFLEENDCDAAPSDVQRLLEVVSQEELDDESLQQVNGGMSKYRLNIEFSQEALDVIYKAGQKRDLKKMSDDWDTYWQMKNEEEKAQFAREHPWVLP